MRILIVTWNGGGNVPPAVELGRRLDQGGHLVEVLGPESLAERFTAEGMGFVARGAQGEWDPTTIALETRAAIEATDADGVVVDYMLPTAICAAVSVERPVVALVHTLYGALLSDGAPHPITMAASVDSLNAARGELGLVQVQRFGDVLDEADTVAVCVPAELDLPVHPMPANLRYIGPLLEGPGADAGWEPPLRDERPLVVVSLGTTPMGEQLVLQRTLDVLADLPVRGLAMLPDHLDPETIEVPGNVSVTGHVRHAAVFAHADAVVGHGGLGTVSAALAHGLPLVCLPLGRDQPENARAVERLGAGVAVPPDQVASRLAAVLGSVLAEGDLRSTAREVAPAFAPSLLDPGALFGLR